MVPPYSDRIPRVPPVSYTHLDVYKRQKLYLSPILDLFNGEIVAWETACRPTEELVKRMLNKMCIRDSFYRRNLAQRYAEEGEIEVRDAVDNSRADAL